MIIEQAARRVQRLEPRMKVLLAADVETPLGSLACRVHDISRTGACLETGTPISTGLEIRFRRDGLDVPGTVAWSRGRRFGIRFAAPIRATDLLIQMSRSRRDQAPPRLNAVAASGLSPSS